MICIGIDTGGTCTDIVAYDDEKNVVIASGKGTTTKDDLSIGIMEVLLKVPEEVRKQAGYLALSTTLATNACVEGKGARAGLIIIGAYKKVVYQYATEYGLPDPTSICLIDGKAGEPLSYDRAELEKELHEKFDSCEYIAIVQMSPDADGGALEEEIKTVVTETLGKGCILGHTMFSELNVLRRAASVYLNAMLIPVMKEFVDAVQIAMKKVDIDIPIRIVRSDGSLMSLEYAMDNPVHTLLCGPASGVIAGQRIAGEKHALVVDMGGTTTDISIVNDYIPKVVDEGIQIGDWRTMVHGVYINTFGLGGDTHIIFDDNGLRLGTRRCVPICVLASRHESVRKYVMELEPFYINDIPSHEFFVMVRYPEKISDYTDYEISICDALKDGPLSMLQLCEKLDIDKYAFDVKRLENEGVIMRSALTPTDIMHIRGQYTQYDVEAARKYALRYARYHNRCSLEELCDLIENMIIKRMYINLAKVIITNTYDLPTKLESSDVIDALALHSYNCEMSRTKKGEEDTEFGALTVRTNATLVGIGAPTHFYLDKVAALLGTTAVRPELAPTANAFGAAVSKLTVRAEVSVFPKDIGYGVRGLTEEEGFYKEIEEAEERALELLNEITYSEAEKRGAMGELEIKITEEEVKTSTNYGDAELFLKKVFKSVGTAKLY